MTAALTVAGLEAALRAAHVVHASASFFAGMCAVTIRVRDGDDGPLALPVAVFGHGATLDAAVADALRKVEVRR